MRIPSYTSDHGEDRGDKGEIPSLTYKIHKPFGLVLNFDQNDPIEKLAKTLDKDHDIEYISLSDANKDNLKLSHGNADKLGEYKITILGDSGKDTVTLEGKNWDVHSDDSGYTITVDHGSIHLDKNITLIIGG